MALPVRWSGGNFRDAADTRGAEGGRADTEIGSADPHGYKNAELPR
jgi:hypothetical protein